MRECFPSKIVSDAGNSVYNAKLCLFEMIWTEAPLSQYQFSNFLSSTDASKTYAINATLSGDSSFDSGHSGNPVTKLLAFITGKLFCTIYIFDRFSDLLIIVRVLLLIVL